MKKTLLVLLFLVATPAFATSGACSSHGGVNCDLKTTSGYAVCSDGFTSSVEYSNMEECQASCWITRTEQVDLEGQVNELTTEYTDWAKRNLDAVLNGIKSGNGVPDQTAIKAIAEIQDERIAALNQQLACSVYPTIVADPISFDDIPATQTPVAVPTVVTTSTEVKTLKSTSKPVPAPIKTTIQIVATETPELIYPATTSIGAMNIVPAPKMSFWARVTGFFRSLFAR